MNRVRLTRDARCRFPDIGTRPGEILQRGADDTWAQVAFQYRQDTMPDDDVFTVAWLRAEDLEQVPDREDQPTGHE